MKALASALCIGVGGSVGREGPIVQIGSAFASAVGQFVRMSETRLRVIVACGAAGGISATFNAPITGLFFGFEIILREFSLDALVATILSSVAGALVSETFFGNRLHFSRRSRMTWLCDTTTHISSSRFWGSLRGSSASASRRCSTSSRISRTPYGRGVPNGHALRWEASLSERCFSPFRRCMEWVTPS